MKKLNKEIEEKAKALNQWILDQEVVKEFQKYETLIHNNPDLLNTEEELKDIQSKLLMLNIKELIVKNLLKVMKTKENYLMKIQLFIIIFY